MKQYFKIENGQKVFAGRRIVIGDMQVINPTHEQYLEAGYEEYVSPDPTPEELLERAISSKIARINNYDTSDAVNSFMMEGNLMWLDKSTRVGLMNSIGIEKEAGREVTNLWFSGMQFTIPVSLAIGILNSLELYALDCYNVTQQHIAAVKVLHTVEEVEAYDYTVGYPEKLVFNLRSF